MGSSIIPLTKSPFAVLPFFSMAFHSSGLKIKGTGEEG